MRAERLELTWVGKSAPARRDPRVLVADLALSASAAAATRRPAEAGNILVHGDNLLSLRALLASHAGKVACAFIDPPYNTGSAFEHYDDAVEHSLWLSMIRERLEVIHRLLSDAGSLWITIDDNEAHYLKVLCDEVFGRRNFVANVVWQKKYTVANDAKWFSDNHDHILVYAKNKETWRPNRLGRTAEMKARYANPDGHEKGVWKSTPLHAKSGKDASFSYTFSNGVTWRPPAGTFPRFSRESLQRMDEADEIWFGRDGTATPSRKTFLKELTSEGTPATTFWPHLEVGNNHEAKNEAKAINADDVFSTPKPERLIQRILEIATKPGDTVLDSFAGSGTTGAVAHKMGRPWIMVEMGEQCLTHILPRMEGIVAGRDKGGISEAVGWAGGGFFTGYRLSPPLVVKDPWGMEVLSRQYDAEMLAEAVCAEMGFEYLPPSRRDEEWCHGFAGERALIHVAAGSIGEDRLRLLSHAAGRDRNLLVCCAAYRGGDGLDNLTVRRLPQCLALEHDLPSRRDGGPAAADQPVREREAAGND